MTKISKKQIYKNYVSGSQLRNFILDDPIIDILNQNSPFIEKSPFINHLFKQGNSFESLINEKLLLDFESHNCSFISKGSHLEIGKDFFNLFNLTLQNINKGVPVIFQPVLFSEKQQLFGIPDLIVKKEFLKKSEIFFPKDKDTLLPLLFNEINNDDYIIIDIKWSTLGFKKNLELRENPKVKSYFSQICLYHQILKEFTKVSNYAIIIGRKSVYSDFTIFKPSAGIFLLNENIQKETEKGIIWRRLLKKNETNWKIKKILSGKQRNFPYSFVDPFPNMKNKYSSHPIKNLIANEISELTNIYYFPRNHSKILHQNGIFNFLNLSDSDLPFQNSKTGIIIKKIIDINKSGFKKFDTSEIKNPEILNSSTSDIFIDFETVSDIFENIDISLTPCYNLISVIGCGFIKNNKWEYKSFIIKEFTKDSEKEIIQDFLIFLKDNFENGSRLIHWSKAELIFLKEHLSLFSDFSFFDLCDFFIQNKIVLFNCFDFKLKNIANTLFNLNLIKTNWGDNTSSPLDSNVNFVECIRTQIKNEEFQNYINYNETDCKVLFEILEFLKLNIK